MLRCTAAMYSYPSTQVRVIDTARVLTGVSAGVGGREMVGDTWPSLDALGFVVCANLLCAFPSNHSSDHAVLTSKKRGVCGGGGMRGGRGGKER